MPRNRVAVIAHEFDIHADWIVAAVSEAGGSPIRLHPGSFADIGPYEIRLGGRMWLDTPSGRFDPTSIRSVYYRRPQPPAPPSDLGVGESGFWVDEAKAVVNGLLSAIPPCATWVNHPDQIRRARNKIHQLRLAEQLGLVISPTLVTSSPESAYAFFIEMDRRVVNKALSYARVTDGTEEAYVYTHRIPEEAGSDYFASVSLGSSILQAEIVSRMYDVRATIVGDEVLACSIETAGDEVDWRLADPAAMQLRAMTLPDDLREALVRLQSELGLRVSQADLVRNRSGDFVFLEMNPNGQWLFVVLATGLEIGAAIAALLTR